MRFADQTHQKAFRPPFYQATPSPLIPFWQELGQDGQCGKETVKSGIDGQHGDQVNTTIHMTK